LCVSQRALPDYGWPLYQFSINMAMLLPLTLRGWRSEGKHSPDVRPERHQQVAALVGAVSLLVGAYGLVFAVTPLPAASNAPPAFLTETGSNVLQSKRLTTLSVSTPAPATMRPTVGATISVPPTPGYIAMAPDGRTALIAHRAAGIVSVFDTATQQVTAQIAMPAPPHFIAFCPTAEDRAAGRAGDRAYISMYDDPTDQPPTGQHRHLVGVLDTTTHKMIATIPVSARPFAPACSPDGTQLWVPSHDDARVDVIDTTTNQLLRTVPVPPNPHRVSFSADRRKIYTTCHESNVVAVIDPTSLAVVHTIPVGVSPHSEALSPDGRSLAVADYSSSQVSIIDTSRDIEIHRFPTGEDPQDVAWSADGKLVYTVNVDGVMNDHPVGDISVINASTGSQTRLVTHDPTVDSAPTSIARSADGATGYITNLHSATLTLLDLTAS
jgi:YVTN family beta-propeller protein